MTALNGLRLLLGFAAQGHAKLAARRQFRRTEQGGLIAQIIEPKFLVGAVSDVGSISGSLFLRRQFRMHEADGTTEQSIYRAEKLEVPPREVIVRRRHVHSPARE